MPWRDTRDPYRILVSELMLQQTQVARVMEKYPAFMRKFPTVRSLARAPLGEVLVLWSGLGYNRRAKYLHLLAKEVVRSYGGKFPDDLESLLSLPGIGLSTAGALLAFAFERDVPMIDTNIRRILARVFFRGEKVPSDKELYAFAVSIIPKGKGREWNYAMLDLGAMKCTARNHAKDCPLAKLHGEVGDFVYKKPQKKFAGSDRYYRGMIIRYLSQKSTATLAVLRNEIGSAKDPDAIISKLVKEGMIEKTRHTYALPAGG
jgi:A/G-specific adenine glycosylase